MVRNRTLIMEEARECWNDIYAPENDAERALGNFMGGQYMKDDQQKVILPEKPFSPFK